MINSPYTSFDEIDRDLQILKLQREIGKEELKLKIQKTKNNLLPTNLLGGASGIIQKVLLTIVAKKLAQRFSP